MTSGITSRAMDLKSICYLEGAVRRAFLFGPRACQGYLLPGGQRVPSLNETLGFRCQPFSLGPAHADGRQEDPTG
jgi:hypothetical protein